MHLGNLLRSSKQGRSAGTFWQHKIKSLELCSDDMRGNRQRFFGSVTKVDGMQDNARAVVQLNCLILMEARVPFRFWYIGCDVKPQRHVSS